MITLFNNTKGIVRHDDDMQFKRLANEIREKHPNDPLSQLKEWEKQPSLYRLMGITKVVQEELHKNNQELNLHTGQLDLLYRAILDLSTHLQEELPDGIHHYNYANIQGVSHYLIECIQGNK